MEVRGQHHVTAALPPGNYVSTKFCVVRTAHFGMKLYIDQRNAHVLIYLSIYFCITCFEPSLSPSSEAGVQIRQ
jgi:hypothetical protein